MENIIGLSLLEMRPYNKGTFNLFTFFAVDKIRIFRKPVEQLLSLNRIWNMNFYIFDDILYVNKDYVN